MNGVILHNIEGLAYVPARAFIDATGDAVLAHLAGVECREAGRDTPYIMPATLPSLFTGIQWQDLTWGLQQEGLHRALAEGHFSQYDQHLPGMSPVGHQVGYLNGGHMFNLNALRCDSLTAGVMLGRRLAKEYLEFYRKYVPGCEEMEHVTTASLIGVRESRRIVGEYELGIEDYLQARQFPDQIGRFNKFIDIHPYDTSQEEWTRFRAEKDDPRWKLGEGRSLGLPYGVLVPRGWENLWVAGRCTSSDVQVHGVIRVQPACSMMGQAAGTAAAQSLRTGQAACVLNTEELIQTLKKQGAALPQTHLSREMTRGGKSEVAMRKSE